MFGYFSGDFIGLNTISTFNIDDAPREIVLSGKTKGPINVSNLESET